MKQIPLTQGKFALVDDDMYPFLSQWNWFAVRSGYGKWYAARAEPGTSGRRRIWMHHAIMNPSPGMEVDHRDGDGLNNQRYNLRECTHAENLRNTKKPPNNTSGYKGVSRHGKGWAADLIKNGKHVFYKTYPSPEEAARAYDRAAREHFGEFAVLNFPE